MPGQIAAADRKLLVIAAAAALFLMTCTVVLAPAGRMGESPVPSTYSSDSGGARAAYLLLQDLHYNVRRWEESPAALTHVGRGAVLILAEPTEKPSAHEREALRTFVQRGGRILFCGGSVPAFFAEATVSPEPFAGAWKEYAASFPSYYSRGAEAVVIRSEALWRQPLQGPIGLYGDSTGAVVASWRIGEGEVLWWAGATPLTNAGIRRSSNLGLFLNAVEGASAIYWDEYFHGQRTSLWAYVEKTPVGWAPAQFALLLIAVLFTYSRRWGPIVGSATVSRLSPLEFVDTLGDLYRRAKATSVAVAVTYRQLRMRLTQQLGVPASAADEELARTAGARLGWKAEELRDTLEKAAAPVGMRPRQALALIQKIEGYTAQLGIRRAPPQETK
jgi:hypothetical protein